MKKILFIILVLVLCVGMVACNHINKDSDDIKSHISYVENAVKVGSNGDFRVEIKDIDGEKALTIDGNCGERNKRLNIKLIPFNLKDIKEGYKLKASNDEKTVLFELHKDILGMSFSVEADREIIDFLPKEVCIIDGDKENKIELKDVLDGAKINNNQAIDLALKEMNNDIVKMNNNEKFKGEIVSKIIHSSKIESSPYYYYISVISSKEKYVSCLIDPMTGEIVGRKIK